MNNRNVDIELGGGVKRQLGHCSFENIISLGNLFLAWFEFRLGKRSKKDVQTFEFSLEDNLFALHQELAAKTYRHSEYTPFFITDPKLRHIHKAGIQDRVLHHAIFRNLYWLFDRFFIYDSYSCRLNKGTHRAVDRLDFFARKLSKNYKVNIWALKCDVSKFFDSVDQGILKQLIGCKIGDHQTTWLINQILDSFEKQPRKGIPLGNVTSQLFANIYLNELDQFIKHKLKIKYYLRYCDDFIILNKDRGILEKLVPEIQNFLANRLKLNLHPRKVIFRKLSQGIDFLGYVILPHHRVVRTRTKRRIIKVIRKRGQEFNSGKISGQSFDQSLQSYLGVLTHADSYFFEQELKSL